MSGRAAWLCVAAVLAAHAAGFVAWWPETVTIADEVRYVDQARWFAQGRVMGLAPALSGGPEREYRPSQYPPLTSILQAPLVLLGGPRAAALLSMLCLLAAVALAGVWLAQSGRSPLWALLILSYPPCLVLGRVAMSDAPNLLFVTVALWLFFRGADRGDAWWLLAGAVAGISLLVRETNVVLFVPLAVGVLVRRDKGTLWLLGGFLAGLAVWAGCKLAVFGSPFFFRDTGYGFSLASGWTNLPTYAAGLLVFVPCGLAGVFSWRGRYRAEVITATLALTLFFAAFDYTGSESGLAERLVLVPRYLMPLLPLLVLGVADLVERLVERSGAGCGVQQRAERTDVNATAGCGVQPLVEPSRFGATAGSCGSRRPRGLVGWAFVLAVLVAVVASHAALGVRGAVRAAAARDVAAGLDPRVPLLVDGPAAFKLANPLTGFFPVGALSGFPPEQASALVPADGVLQVLSVEREVSPHALAARDASRAWLERMGARCPPRSLLDRTYGSGERVRVWALGPCR